MASTQSNPEYLNYYDYRTFKEKFNPYWKTDFNQEKFDKVLNNTLDNNVKRKYNDILEEIFRHINNHNVFMKYDAGKACNYISYILHKVVENKKGIEYNKDTFNTTKKFVEEFKKEDRYTNDYCESKMVYINDAIYEKMKNLYDLYENYYEYTDKYKNWRHYKDKCDTIGRAMYNHNMIIKYHQDDEDLVRKSLIVKSLIEKLTLQPPNECKYTIRELEKSNLEIRYEREKQRQAEEAKKEMLRRKQAEEEEQQMLRREREQREREEQQRERVEEQQRERVEEQQEQREGLKSVLVQVGDISGTHRGFGTTENEVLSSSPHDPEERLPENPISSSEQPYLEGNIYTDSQASSLELLGRKKGELDQLDVGIHESENSDVHQIVRPGTTGSITDTISGFIRDVEPGPVLGVSGGMGVLFLLFKYTPVGSFFGGRRGRIRQIPSSFRGFPPGYFANFQEYDGGLIGYSPMSMSSLAE